MHETWVRYLAGEDPLEEEMATHSSIHAQKTPWMEKPGELQSMDSQKKGDQKCIWRKVPQAKEGNRYPSTRGTEGPIHYEPKQTYTKTYHN